MGNLLAAPVTDKETHVGVTADNELSYGVSTMQGWRVHMEDGEICAPRLYAMNDDNTRMELPGHSLFAVFDGHGGSFSAMYASKNLCRVLSRQAKFVQYAAFVKERSSKEASFTLPTERAKYVRQGLELLEESLKDTFVELDREIFQSLQGVQHPDANIPYDSEAAVNSSQKHIEEEEEEKIAKQDSGTTAVVVVITPQWVVCANAGDSRAVFSKGGQKAVPLSYDHKPDDEEEERRIRAAGGYVAGGRVEMDLAVSRGLGDYRFKVPQVVLGGMFRNNDTNVKRPHDQKVSPVPDVIVQNRNKEHDEFIIVACDGIWDVQTNYEAVKNIANIFEEGESDLGILCEEVLDLCLIMGSRDNMTALVIKFEAQKVGEGGGVLLRRQARQNMENKNEDS